MALYVVERDLGGVAPEQIRLDQRDVASACLQLKAQGRRIRYVSSAVVPEDARGLDVFGAESVDVVKEAHAAAGVSYARIVEVLDLTPSFVGGVTSRARRPLRSTSHSAAEDARAKRTTEPMTEHASSDLARWLAEGQRFFAVCLETLENVERMQTRAATLEAENEILREEMARLRHRADILQTERTEMIAAFNDLAGHVTQVVDHILQKSEDGESGSK